MVVCICTGASERDIRRAVEGGAASLGELYSSCQAGQGCGECHPVLLEMLGRDPCGDWRGAVLSAAVRLPTVAPAAGSRAERRSS